METNDVQYLDIQLNKIIFQSNNWRFMAGRREECNLDFSSENIYRCVGTRKWENFQTIEMWFWWTDIVY